MQNPAILKKKLQLCGIALPMLDRAQITALRERMGLSQAEMASTVGVSSRFTVSQWERGVKNPSAPVMRFLSLLYSLPSSELRAITRRLEKISQDEIAAHEKANT